MKIICTVLIVKKTLLYDWTCNYHYHFSIKGIILWREFFKKGEKINFGNLFFHVFMPPLRSSRRHYVFGLSVRPSVRTSVRTYVPFLWSRYLKNRLMDSCQTLVMYVSCRADELIRFWGHEVKGQRSQGSLCMQKQLVIALSEEPIDGFLPNFGHVCILQSQWTD